MATSVSGATDTEAVEALKETVASIQKLTDTINRNNEITAQQNQKLVGYNRWLVGLTIGISALGIIQLLVMIFQWVETCRP